MYNTTGFPIYSNPYMTYTGMNNPSVSIPKVTGIEGAKAYPMGANQSVALFDSNDNIFFLKTTDSAGFASYRTFRFTEETQAASDNNGVSRSEFDELKSMVQKLVDSSEGE